MEPGTFNIIGDISLVSFGKLIKNWAADPDKRPKDLSTFKQQLDDENINYQLSPEITCIRFHDREETVLSILLPLDSLVKAQKESGDYPIPSGYSRLKISTKDGSGRIDGFVENDGSSFDDFLEINDFRVGDYCSSQCA